MKAEEIKDADLEEDEYANKVGQIEGYWEFKRFYLRKKPIVAMLLIISAIVGVLFAAMPFLVEIGGKIWDFWFAEGRLSNVALDKLRLRF